jgi:hypothetical protein
MPMKTSTVNELEPLFAFDLFFSAELVPLLTLSAKVAAVASLLLLTRFAPLERLGAVPTGRAFPAKLAMIPV